MALNTNYLPTTLKHVTQSQIAPLNALCPGPGYCLEHNSGNVPPLTGESGGFSASLSVRVSLNLVVGTQPLWKEMAIPLSPV